MAYEIKADINISIWENIKNALALMTTTSYFNRRTNMTFHDLCKISSRPPNSSKLLGLSLKFCAQQRHPPKKQIEEGIERFTRDIRIKYFMTDYNDGEDDDNYNPKLYTRSEWIPPRAPDKNEKLIKNFQEGLIARQTLLNNIIKPATNLTAIQHLILITLRNSTEFDILSTDKNIGPAIMEWQGYVFRMLDEYLRDGKGTYLNRTENQALQGLNDLDSKMREILHDHEEDLIENERIYFLRGLKTQDRISQIYDMPKVHKPMIPKLKLKHVTSNCGSLSAVASRYIEYYLHKLVLLSPSYLRDPSALQDVISSLGYQSSLLSEGTSDATAMYTNMDPIEGVRTIEKYFDAYAHEYNGFFPQELILKLLELVMNTSIFQFGNSWWKQMI